MFSSSLSATTGHSSIDHSNQSSHVFHGTPSELQRRLTELFAENQRLQAQNKDLQQQLAQSLQSEEEEEEGVERPKKRIRSSPESATTISFFPDSKQNARVSFINAEDAVVNYLKEQTQDLQELENKCKDLLIFYPDLEFSSEFIKTLSSSPLTEELMFRQLVSGDYLASSAVVAYVIAVQHRRYSSEDFKTLFNKLGANKAYEDLGLIIKVLTYDIRILDGGPYQEEEVLKLLDSVQNRHPALKLTMKGKVLLQKKNPDFSGAIDYFNQALTLCPRHAFALTLRAEAYNNSGQKDLAAQDFNLALEMNPQEPAALIHRGILSYQQGKLEEAQKDFQHITKKDWQNNWLYNKNNYTFYLAYQIELYQRALFSNPFRDHWKFLNKQADNSFKPFQNAALFDHVKDPFLLGRLTFYRLSALGNTKNESIANCLAKIPQAPYSQDSWILTDAALHLILMRDNTQDPKGYLDQALVLDPQNMASRCIRGQYLFMQGKYEEARQDFQAILEKDPHHLLARFKCAELLVAQNKSEQALQELDNLLKIHPECLVALALQIKILYENGNIEKTLAKIDDYMGCKLEVLEPNLEYQPIRYSEEVISIWLSCVLQKQSLDELLEDIAKDLEKEGSDHSVELHDLPESGKQIVKSRPQFKRLYTKQLILLNQMHKLPDDGKPPPLFDNLSCRDYLYLKQLIQKKGMEKTLEDSFGECFYDENPIQVFLYNNYSNLSYWAELKGNYYLEQKKWAKAKEEYSEALQFCPPQQQPKLLGKLAECEAWIKGLPSHND